jgi:hypothetical protein
VVVLFALVLSGNVVLDTVRAAPEPEAKGMK